MIQQGNLPTLLSADRIANLVKYSHYASRLEGHVAEIGTYKGGSLEMLAKLNQNTTVYGIDSFSGLPEPKMGEFHHQGDFSDVDYASIAGYFKMMHPNVRILRGFTPEVFTFFDETARFRFVHIDVDLYTSVLDSLTFFLPRVTVGGVIILDDYKVNSTPGCKKAVDEYFSNHSCTHRQELKYFNTESSESCYQYLIVK